MANNSNNEGIDYTENKDDDENDVEVGTKWESLYIRIARMRLEEANTKRFLKAIPAKLPYNECKEWAKRQNMWQSKEDWDAWIDLGESLSAYIPSDPESYFTRQGTWVSWEDFLGFEE
eukprot:CAMPEP_0194109270 /NCGR_PEP_ID=MMETSP0150-20130528/8802_1 /TAXON_ID=122233 /ORGANISM="Chaetoceros debilis, Strain MM31A-1" /LENGTH=117 /DNA_ID=CAMNT_0038798193 /DNA_START=256 /DNA_END=609 /DNA_ORIENTATION=-